MKKITSQLLFLKVTILWIWYILTENDFLDPYFYMFYNQFQISPPQKRKQVNVLVHLHTYHIYSYQPVRLNYGILRLPAHCTKLQGKAKIFDVIPPYYPPGSFFILALMRSSWMLLCSITRVVLQCWVLNTVSTTSQRTAQV